MCMTERYWIYYSFLSCVLVTERECMCVTERVGMCMTEIVGEISCVRYREGVHVYDRQILGFDLLKLRELVTLLHAEVGGHAV